MEKLFDLLQWKNVTMQQYHLYYFTADEIQLGRVLMPLRENESIAVYIDGMHARTHTNATECKKEKQTSERKEEASSSKLLPYICMYVNGIVTGHTSFSRSILHRALKMMFAWNRTSGFLGEFQC